MSSAAHLLILHKIGIHHELERRHPYLCGHPHEIAGADPAAGQVRGEFGAELAPVAVAGAVFERDLLVLGQVADDGGRPAGGGADLEDGRAAGGRFGGLRGREERHRGQEGEGGEGQGFGFLRAHGGTPRKVNQDLRGGLVPGQLGVIGPGDEGVRG